MSLYSSKKLSRKPILVAKDRKNSIHDCRFQCEVGKTFSACNRMQLVDAYVWPAADGLSIAGPPAIAGRAPDAYHNQSIAQLVQVRALACRAGAAYSSMHPQRARGRRP